MITLNADAPIAEGARNLTSTNPADSGTPSGTGADPAGDAAARTLSSAITSLGTNANAGDQTIMDTYATRRSNATAQGEAQRALTNNSYAGKIEDSASGTATSLNLENEARRGFATNTALMKQISETGAKRIRELARDRDSLLLQSKYEDAGRLDKLVTDEQDAITTSRKNWLDSFLNLQKASQDAAAEERAKRSFETPQEKRDADLKTSSKSAILALQQNAPDAGITATDTYDQAIEKYRNSATYKRDVRKGEVDIQAVEANIRQSNAAAAKSLSDANGGGGLGASNYDGSFAATLNQASQLLGADKAKSSLDQLQRNIAAGDYASAYTTIANNVSQGLTGTNKTTYDDARTDIPVMEGMRNAIKEYTDAGGNVGFLKGTADNIAKKFGQLKTDPKFAALAVQLEREFQAYRQSMTGAAFGPGESADYAKVNPRANASLDLNLATIDGALSQLNNRVQGTINARVPGAQYIKEYANGAKAGGGGLAKPEAPAPTVVPAGSFLAPYLNNTTLVKPK